MDSNKSRAKAKAAKRAGTNHSEPKTAKAAGSLSFAQVGGMIDRAKASFIQTDRDVKSKTAMLENAQDKHNANIKHLEEVLEVQRQMTRAI